MHESESEVAQSCPTPRDPMDCSLPGSSVHGICQARNQGKLEVVKQEMARVNVDILGIGKLEWVNLTQMTIISPTAGRNPLEEME